jgi:hypothetical protein
MPLERTPLGQVVLYHRATGEKFVRWTVDAREMLQTGEYVVDPADADEAVQDAPADDPPASPEQQDDPLLIPLAPENNPAAGTAPREHSPGVPLNTVAE